MLYNTKLKLTSEPDEVKVRIGKEEITTGNNDNQVSPNG